jgi:hypothetical protein
MTAVRTLAIALVVVIVGSSASFGGHMRRGSFRWTYFAPDQTIPPGYSPPQATAPVAAPVPVYTPATPPPVVSPPAMPAQADSNWPTGVANPEPQTTGLMLAGSPLPSANANAAPTQPNMTPWVSIQQVVSNPAPPPAPAMTSAASVPAAQTFAADAFINLGNAPYTEASLLTTGGAQPWYDSPVVDKLFNGQPTASQIADFSNTILQRVQHTYQLSGVPVHLTIDPTVSAAHTVSVVSNTSYTGNANAIGITDMGNNGFSFIDKIATYANSVDQLEWAVAHNVAHELMHSFGVDHHDTTGTYLDAATSPWSVLIDPNTVFGPAAVQDLLSKNFQDRANPTSAYGAQGLDPGTSLGAQPVPEPTTWAMWGLVGVCVSATKGLRSRRVRSPLAA